MSKTGINFARCNVVSAKLHNERDAAYLEALERSGKKTYDIFHDRTATNLHWTNPAYAGKSLEQILEDCRERYTDSTGQAPQEQDRVRKVKDKKTGLYKEVTTAGWSPIREGVCPVKEDTRLSDFNPLINHLATKGVRVISIDIHRDEGYQDPVTGERKYNYHAHVIADWTDRVTGKTAKLNKADMSKVQTVLADALHMERGESKKVTGKYHLTPAQQREKAAAENAARLEAKAAELEAETERAAQAMIEAQQQEAEAIEKARTAKKAASREQFRSSAADVGARVLNVFGRGAVAEAHADRDEALERAEAAEQQAAADRKAREAAEEAAKDAQNSRTAAETARSRAEKEKAEYGRERYEAGQAEGFKAGRQSVADSIAPLQQQLAAKQATIDKLQSTRDERLDTATAELRQRAEAAEKELEDLVAWNPNMKNWRQCLADMRTAGLSDETIQGVFRNGSATVTVDIKHNFKTYPVETVVFIGTRKTAANTTRNGVWFKFQESWCSVKTFLSKALEHIRQLHPSRGLGLH